MATPQPGIFAIGTPAHTHLEFDLAPGADPRALVVELASLRSPREVTAGVNLVVGVGAQAWRSVAPDATPVDAGPFEAIAGPDGFEFPATQHDAWVWIATASRDVAFDTARAIVAALAGVAELADDVDGFAYRDARDLSGFIDGTANRPLDEAAEVAVVPDGQPGAGASIAIVQRWIHDLDAMGALPVAEQEKIFGRTKEHGIEFEEADMPEDAHIARVEIDDEDGSELELFRRSVPIGDVRAAGLQFVGFSSTRATIDAMLRSMAGVGDRVRDRLTRFSTPVTGSYYVVPSVETLREFARAVDD